MKLKNIHEEMQINIGQEKMWAVLSRFGDVSGFHAGVVDSFAEQGSESTAAPGCERVCKIVDLGLRITLKERIVEFTEGESYRFEVYEWKNFPLRKMLFGFRIVSAMPTTRTLLAIDIDYTAKPAFLTPLMAGKMHRLARDVLLGYKHYAETGEKRVPIRELKNRYREVQRAEMQYG